MTGCKTCGYIITADGLECMCEHIKNNITKTDKPTYEQMKKAYKEYMEPDWNSDTGKFWDILAMYFKDEVLEE